MTTPITPITAVTKLGRLARAYSVPLVLAGALAAGCGSATYSSAGSHPAAAAGGTASKAAPGSVQGSGGADIGTSGPIAHGAPMIPAGFGACTGWPANAPHGKLTAFFAPVAVERCVVGFQDVAGKAVWETATLERSTDNIAALVAALLRPTASHHPMVFCPEVAFLPPQIVLINAKGQELVPRLPIGACGTVTEQVQAVLSTMKWQTLSVHRVMRISTSVTPKTFPGASLAPGSPKVEQTGGATGQMNGQPVSS